MNWRISLSGTHSDTYTRRVPCTLHSVTGWLYHVPVYLGMASELNPEARRTVDKGWGKRLVDAAS